MYTEDELQAREKKKTEAKRKTQIITKSKSILVF